MKIIHCADLHLNSSLSAHLDTSKADEKNRNMIDSFLDMVNYADSNGINHIIIAGDLFDRSTIKKTYRDLLIESVKTHSNINFYYLRGNHDASSFITGFGSKPDNLLLFDENSIVSFDASDKVKISGIELTKDNIDNFYVGLNLDPQMINIFVLHGQESKSKEKKDGYTFNLEDLKRKNINYLALGHLHTFRKGDLDGNGIYCYSGCLESRGFDEFGDHGYVILDIDEVNNVVTPEFKPVVPKHNLRHIYVDVTNSNDIQNSIITELSNQNAIFSDIIKVELVGDIDYNASLSCEAYENNLKNNYFAIEVVDSTKKLINFNSLKNNVSLAGEFVRVIDSDPSLSDERKQVLARYGIEALKGEDIE